MNLVPPSADDRRLVRLHVVILLSSWLIGTALVLQANAMAPTTPPPPVTASYLAQLRGSWAWYAAGYGLFFVADGSIALLGAALAAWLQPGAFRGPAIVVLFLLSGLLGMLADTEMMAAAQAFRLGTPALEPASAPAWLDGLDTRCNWLSAASFLPAGIGAWLAGAAAQAKGVSPGWIALTRFGALYQIAAGLLSAAAFLTGWALLIDIALLVAIMGMPIFATIWLGWMLRELTAIPNRRKSP